MVCIKRDMGKMNWNCLLKVDWEGKITRFEKLKPIIENIDKGKCVSRIAEANEITLSLKALSAQITEGGYCFEEMRVNICA